MIVNQASSIRRCRPAAPPGPPPLFSQWESDMTTYGASWGAYQNPGGPNNWTARFLAGQYDVLQIMYLIKTYTGQSSPWDTYIGYAKDAWRNVYYSGAEKRLTRRTVQPLNF